MINLYIRDIISNCCSPEVYVFDNPSFDKSILGIDIKNNVVTYSYDSMVRELSEENNITEEEAAEFIDYNTLRALDYLEESKRPRIVVDLYD